MSLDWDPACGIAWPREQRGHGGHGLLHRGRGAALGRQGLDHRLARRVVVVRVHATSKEATRREARDHAATLAGAHNSPRGDGRAGLAPALAALVPAVDGALLLGTLFGEGPEVAGEPLPWLHRRPYSTAPELPEAAAAL